jgi:hypothetical protein
VPHGGVGHRLADLCARLATWLHVPDLHLRHIEARIFDVLFRTPYVIVRYRTNTYILRVFGQCGVLGFPFGTTTSTPTIVG